MGSGIDKRISETDPLLQQVRRMISGNAKGGQKTALSKDKVVAGGGLPLHVLAAPPALVPLS